ncbi:2-dehydro-3-deoxygalactonokinase [Sinomicrobium sp.]
MKLFLSIDWGTSSFRARLIETDLNSIKILHEIKNNQGISRIHQSWLKSDKGISRFQFFLNVLDDTLKTIKTEQKLNIDNAPIVISGMASSSIGWFELPYSSLPFALDGSGLNYKIIEIPSFSHPVLLLSGICSDDDIMRGEEIQLLGCYTNAETDSVYVFPGTHSKHIHIKDGKVISFRTYMTGEIFQLLTENSILKDNVEKSVALHCEDFVSGIHHARENNFLNALFKVRTNEVLHKMNKANNYSFLSGLLIGTEILELSKNDHHIYLCPHKNLSKNYTIAIKESSLANRATILSHEEVDNSVIKGHLLMLKKHLLGWT